jgi:hypothetical protein
MHLNFLWLNPTSDHGTLIEMFQPPARSKSKLPCHRTQSSDPPVIGSCRESMVTYWWIHSMRMRYTVIYIYNDMYSFIQLMYIYIHIYIYLHTHKIEYISNYVYIEYYLLAVVSGFNQN